LCGALLIALPLWQVLRFQNAELAALRAEREGLDPMARAIAVQRGLLVHRPLAAQVLDGEVRVEPERRLRQVEIDLRVAALTRSLAGSSRERAGLETEALRNDWSVLAQQVRALRISAAQSNEAHGLLLEQTLLVIDLVADAMSPRALGAAPRPAEATASLQMARALPRLALQTAALAASRPVSARQVQAAHESLSRVLRAVESGREPLPDGRSADAELLRAATQTAAAADAFFLSLHGASAADEAAQAAGAAAVEAQFRLFEAVQASASAALARRTVAAWRERAGLLAADLVLALTATALWAGLWRGRGQAGRSTPRAAAPASERLAAAQAFAEAAAPPDANRAAAGRLMDRLREGEAGADRIGTEAGMPRKS
jgi:hypothetical protein